MDHFVGRTDQDIVLTMESIWKELDGATGAFAAPLALLGYASAKIVAAHPYLERLRTNMQRSWAKRTLAGILVVSVILAIMCITAKFAGPPGVAAYYAAVFLLPFTLRAIGAIDNGPAF